MERFYWLIEGEIAGCSRPGGTRPAATGVSPDGTARPTANGSSLDADLAWLRGHGIGGVLSLTEEALDQDALARHELAAMHLPVPDMTAPFPEQFARALDFIDRQRSTGRAVAVHCLMGQGRTGAILAAYLIRRGSSADDAVGRLRDICPGALAAPEQERALHLYAERRDWIV
ncbi:MAG TPA: dual specificity protein phosphatase family protein [Chloroflexota bacterium]|nr:dual specificity protein phosphatase family protein [Chloroflexota bacterium]